MLANIYCMYMYNYADSGTSSPSEEASATQNSTNTEATCDSLSPGLLRSVQAAGDRLVSKEAQLIQNKTTNLSESLGPFEVK